MRTAALTSILALAVGSIGFAQSWRPPSPSARCPSKWGAGDERGASNHVTATELGQIGTQFDMLSHQGIDDSLAAREPEAGSTRRGACLRVCVHRATAEDQGRHGFNRRANRDLVGKDRINRINRMIDEERRGK